MSIEKNITDLLLETIAPVFDIWILISILVTLTLVQMVKVVVKHYQEKYLLNDKFFGDTMLRKILLFWISVFIGYIVSRNFLEGHIEDWKHFAYAIAFLNPLLYILFLSIAEKLKLTRLVAFLKMRSLPNENNTNSSDK